MSSELAQLIQTVAIVITGAIVAWYTSETRRMRLNAAEQNRLLAEQLAMMQRSLDFDMHKESAVSEPYFRFGGGSSGIGYQSCEIFNEGGPASDIGIGADAPGIEATVTPRDMIQTHQKGTVQFRALSGPLPQSFTFTISYKTRLGKTGQRRFSVVQNSAPQPLQEA